MLGSSCASDGGSKILVIQCLLWTFLLAHSKCPDGKNTLGHQSGSGDEAGGGAETMCFNSKYLLVGDRLIWTFILGHSKWPREETHGFVGSFNVPQKVMILMMTMVIGSPKRLSLPGRVGLGEAKTEQT